MVSFLPPPVVNFFVFALFYYFLVLYCFYSLNSTKCS